MVVQSKSALTQFSRVEGVDLSRIWINIFAFEYKPPKLFQVSVQKYRYQSINDETRFQICILSLFPYNLKGIFTATVKEKRKRKSPTVVTSTKCNHKSQCVATHDVISSIILQKSIQLLQTATLHLQTSVHRFHLIHRNTTSS